MYLLLLSYRPDPAVTLEKNGIAWVSESLRPFGPKAYFRRLVEIIGSFRPDWVVGFSDTYYGILAEYFGRKFGIRSAIDAYDNYESYIPWLTPLHLLWRRALSRASVVTAAGPQLAELLQRSGPGRPVHIVPMAADPEFKPMDPAECRRQLHLPFEGRIIGYCGSITRSRGIETLFEAFDDVKRMHPETRLILSGRRESSVQLPHGVQWLGYLPDRQMPCVLNSMDVLAIVNRLSAFGRFSYPAKLYEAIRCRVPVVATATEPAKWILNNREEFLARPDDPLDLKSKIEELLTQGHRPAFYDGGTWIESVEKFEDALGASNWTGGLRFQGRAA